MSGIQVIKIMKEEVHDLPEENIKGVFLPRTFFSSASVGIVEPQKTQTRHYHNRVNDGVEIVFIYAGKCTLLTDEGESEIYDIDRNGPIYVCVPTKTVAHIKNVGMNNVHFFSVFTPGLIPEELVFLE